MLPFPGDPSIQILPTLGPKDCKYYLHWAISTPRDSKGVWPFVRLGPASARDLKDSRIPLGIQVLPSIQIVPTLDPKVCKYYLHWAIWIPSSIVGKLEDPATSIPIGNGIMTSRHFFIWNPAFSFFEAAYFMWPSNSTRSCSGEMCFQSGARPGHRAL